MVPGQHCLPFIRASCGKSTGRSQTPDRGGCWSSAWIDLGRDDLRIQPEQRVRHPWSAADRDHPVHHLLPDHRWPTRSSGAHTGQPARARSNLGRWGVAGHRCSCLRLTPVVVMLVLSLPAPFPRVRQGAGLRAWRWPRWWYFGRPACGGSRRAPPASSPSRTLVQGPAPGRVTAKAGSHRIESSGTSLNRAKVGHRWSRLPAPCSMARRSARWAVADDVCPRGFVTGRSGSVENPRACPGPSRGNPGHLRVPARSATKLGGLLRR